VQLKWRHSLQPCSTTHPKAFQFSRRCSCRRETGLRTLCRACPPEYLPLLICCTNSSRVL
jgi:hypothetical protein